MVGVEPQYFGQMLPGLGEVPLVGQGHPQVIIRFGMVGLEAERFHILLHYFLRFALPTQSVPQIVMRISIERQRSAANTGGFMAGSVNFPTPAYPIAASSSPPPQANCPGAACASSVGLAQ